MTKPQLPNRVGAVSFRPKVSMPAPRADVKEEKTLVDAASAPLDNRYERIDLPSGYVPYAFESMAIRKITAVDHAKIFRAVRHRNLTILLDALSATITEDIRKLVLEDFRAVCYWHRTNSYLSTPINITWTTLYGNKSSTSVPASALVYEVTTVEKSRADYAADRARGFVLPTASDLETLLQLADEEQVFLFEQAQYIDSAPLAAKIAELSKTSKTPSFDARIARFQELSVERGLEIMDEIAEYATSYRMGITERAKVKDLDFDPSKCAEYVELMQSALQDADTSDEEAKILSEEIERLTAAIESNATTELTAREEVHTLPFNVWSFFPRT